MRNSHTPPFRNVPNLYIRCMTKLQQWMTKHEQDDAAVARAVRLSRPQISRIRRGLHATRRTTADRLEKLTGIRWWHFMEIRPTGRPPRKAGG